MEEEEGAAEEKEEEEEEEEDRPSVECVFAFIPRASLAYIGIPSTAHADSRDVAAGTPAREPGWPRGGMLGSAAGWRRESRANPRAPVCGVL
jgi:hypothetical protein